MRLPLFTLLLLLLAALIIMVGGYFGARSEVKEVFPLDQSRFQEVSKQFATELERLDALYHQHLDVLAAEATYLPPERFKEAAESLNAVAHVGLFQDKTLLWESSFTPKGILRFSYIEPSSTKSTVLWDTFYVNERMSSPALQATHRAEYALYLKTFGEQCVAILVNKEELYETTSLHFKNEMGDIFTSLEQSRQTVALVDEESHTLVRSGKKQSQPETLSNPLYSSVGFWSLAGWDQVETQFVYDGRVLLITSLLGVLLCLGGVFLFRLQDKALKLAAQRVSFVNNVSHELSTPLTNIALSLSLIQDSPALTNDLLRKRVGVANEEVERLSRLVKNVLQLAKGSRTGEKRCEEYARPDELIEKTLQVFQLALKRKEIETHLSLNTPEETLLDADAFCQIMANLISNVEKHAASGKFLAIQSAQEEGHIKIRVEDKGGGIPDKFKKRIFLAFKRVENKTNEGASGTGLGLGIGRSLAEKMGGTLELLKTEEGANFLLTLPFKPKKSS